MRNLTKEFTSKSINYKKLLEYGFSKHKNYYSYENNIYNNHFKVIIELSNDKQISRVVDLSNDEEYILVDVANATGEFVGKVKKEYETILNDMIKDCTTPNVFKSNQAKKVIKYIKEKYNDDLEFLWPKFSDNAIWRNKINNKWYGLLVLLPESKLGITSDRIIDIIDLRYQKDNIKNIIDNIKIFKGYHMNKDNWITIRLDGSVDTKEIFRLIDNSYKISLKK